MSEAAPSIVVAEGVTPLEVVSDSKPSPALRTPKKRGRRPKDGGSGKKPAYKYVKKDRSMDWNHATYVPQSDKPIYKLRQEEAKPCSYSKVKSKFQQYHLIEESLAKNYLPDINVTSQVSFEHHSTEGTICSRPLTSHMLPNRRGFLLNSGGSVWGLDWCPEIPSGENQFLAVAGYKGTTGEHHIIGERETNSTGYIEIWNLGPIANDVIDEETEFRPWVDICFVHLNGCVWDLKWCPYGAYDTSKEWNGEDEIPKIGIIAACFGDGTLKIFSVPNPDVLRKKLEKQGHSYAPNKTIYVQLDEVLFEAQLPDTSLWNLSWGGHKWLSTGCTNGISEYYMVHYLPAHDSCVRRVSWRSVENTDYIVSCGHDGRLLVCDLRDPYTDMLTHRIRAFLMAASWVKFESSYSIVFTDAENGVRLTEKDDIKKSVGIITHKGCIWHVDCSSLHPFVASGASDGSVRSTNLRHLRARNQASVFTGMTLYTLKKDSEKNEFIYDDNVVFEPLVAHNHTPDNLFTMFFAPEVAIQRVSWCPNPQSAAWIASGGTAGLVRVESASR
ncbi:WD40 repeat-like protein [Basidiobolus meristosporus CBS 931.73]|uniref:WD40 repeat-like protein n=1 Tax=Basidiobolus meristosporus CBS 931.73 TaxID=1314790 RepID=A0A1Y1Z2C0_9FUNG|nr:WD40 repeat-like protein [Basidiobolus meristosporus CBS 931.73]|eukprot:ORY04349.1 WD40 repeat-like protein [Basidiobolus meristosporus CBS 931.73]